MKKLLPCKSCPWRVENDASVIPNYRQEKAEGLVDTIGKGDGLRRIMACHNSTDINMTACNGYLARHGWSNINVRILLAHGQINNPDKVLAACEKHGVELEIHYPAVLAKLTESEAA